MPVEVADRAAPGARVRAPVGAVPRHARRPAGWCCRRRRWRARSTWSLKENAVGGTTVYGPPLTLIFRLPPSQVGFGGDVVIERRDAARRHRTASRTSGCREPARRSRRPRCSRRRSDRGPRRRCRCGHPAASRRSSSRDRGTFPDSITSAPADRPAGRATLPVEELRGVGEAGGADRRRILRQQRLEVAGGRLGAHLDREHGVGDFGAIGRLHRLRRAAPRIGRATSPPSTRSSQEASIASA